MADTFSGNAIATIEEDTISNSSGEILSEGIFILNCKKRIPSNLSPDKFGYVFAGVNFFGNEFVVGRFKPIRLDKEKTLKFRFKCLSNGGRFYIKLKANNYYETQKIAITGKKDNLNSFELPMEDPRLEALFRDTNEEKKYLINISISTDFKDLENNEVNEAVIELSEFSYE